LNFYGKNNKIRHLTLSLFILIVFLCSFLFPFPSDFEFAEGTTFSFDLTSPTPNEFLKDKNVKFMGTYTGTTLTVIMEVDSDPPLDISNQITTENNTWFFSGKEFSDGQYTVTFTVDTVRPVISNGYFKLISTVNGNQVEPLILYRFPTSIS
jgi:hypothetical protein